MAPQQTILFAQKASAVSKCAGLDPRDMDLEKFRTMAPVIFVRAFNAIYKEKLPSTNPYTGEEDPKVGAQAVIDRLFEKTQVSALQTITGGEVAEGSHRAIGVLVGVLFAEGQRMWLAKQDEKRRPPAVLVQESRAGAAILDDNDDEDDDRHQHHLQLRQQQRPATAGPASSPKKQRKAKKKKRPASAAAAAVKRAVPEYGDEQFEDDDDANVLPSSSQGDDVAPQMRIAADNERDEDHELAVDEENPSPEDVRLLMNRIADLEAQLKKSSAESSARGKIRRFRSKESGGSSAAIAAAAAALPPPQAPNAPQQPWLPRAVRPSSAPSIRRKLPAAQSSAAPEVGEEARADSAVAVAAAAAAAPTPTTPPLPALPKYPASWYTYDMSSGRRVLMSEAEREALEARRKKETLGNVKSMSEMVADGGGAGGGGGGGQNPKPPRPVSPRDEVAPVSTQPQWPGPSTAHGTENWIKKHLAAREPTGKLGLPLTDKSEAVQAAIAAFKEAKNHPAYRLLEEQDLVISIEHCHSCELHNVTLRHKTGEYIKRADAFLRALAQVAHECNLAARVGVTRFNTHLIASKKISDADNRIGAFEIQAAYRTSRGELKVELLHTKLGSTQWPSRRGLELKLRAFLSRADVAVPTYYKRPDASEGYSETRTGGLGSYPVGIGSFAETPVGDATWSYAMAVAVANPSAAPAAAPGPATTMIPSSPTHTHKTHATHATDDESTMGTNALQSVQWVFDARGVSVPPLFEPGTTVWVTGASKGQARGPPERHPLLAVVKSVPVDPTGNVRVKLKYHNAESTVKEDQLMSLSDHVPDDDLAAREEVPSSLCVVLLLAGLQQTGKAPPSLPLVGDGAKSPIQFSINETGVDRRDSDGYVHLGRSSLFHQLRNLAAAVETKWGDEDHFVSHPALGESVDAQLSYSENTLNWISSKLGQVVNTMELQRRAVQWAMSGAQNHANQQAAAQAQADAEAEQARLEAEARVEAEAQFKAKAQAKAQALSQAQAEALALAEAAQGQEQGEALEQGEGDEEREQEQEHDGAEEAEDDGPRVDSSNAQEAEAYGDDDYEEDA